MDTDYGRVDMLMGFDTDMDIYLWIFMDMDIWIRSRLRFSQLVIY